MITPETACFFANRPRKAALYAVFSRALETLGPYRMRVQKTQITFDNRRVFACVSLRGKGCIVISFGLPVRIASNRIWQAVQPYPDRWTHHVRITEENQIDPELMEWLSAAYAFAGQK